VHSIEGLATADLVDAMGRLHRHRCHILDLVSPTPGRVLFGPAVTISYFPSCSAALDPERYNLAKLFYEAVGDEPEGKVVVLASNGYADSSMGGGTKLSRLQVHGCAGVITDGRLRDFDELARYDFAAYCSGEATKWGGDEVTPFQANVPVVLSGVGVIPGQYVFADSSGAVVIPDRQIDDVLAGARAVKDEDAGFRAQIATERLGALPGKRVRRSDDNRREDDMSDEVEITNHRADATQNESLIGMARMGADAFGYTAELRIDRGLAQLLRLRVSQLNNCSYCLNLHYEAARDAGIPRAKIDTLTAWWETDLHSEAEQAALRYTEALTRAPDRDADQAFQRFHDGLAKHFDAELILEIIGVVLNMNVWTRLKLAEGAKPRLD
jgi:4-hydroxy-4-methyl-2-oxoglutarate aldolase